MSKNYTVVEVCEHEYDASGRRSTCENEARYTVVDLDFTPGTLGFKPRRTCAIHARGPSLNSGSASISDSKLPDLIYGFVYLLTILDRDGVSSGSELRKNLRGLVGILRPGSKDQTLEDSDAK
jgi:hypothetical protein